MPLSEDEAIARQIRMYGLTQADLDKQIRECGIRATMLAVSILSDVQEEVYRMEEDSPERCERVRQMVNRVKHIIIDYTREMTEAEYHTGS